MTGNDKTKTIQKLFDSLLLSIKQVWDSLWEVANFFEHLLHVCMYYVCQKTALDCGR